MFLKFFFLAIWLINFLDKHFNVFTDEYHCKLIQTTLKL